MLSINSGLRSDSLLHLTPNRRSKPNITANIFVYLNSRHKRYCALKPFSHKYPTNLFSYVVVNLLLYCYKCLFDSEACFRVLNKDLEYRTVTFLSL